MFVITMNTNNRKPRDGHLFAEDELVVAGLLCVLRYVLLEHLDPGQSTLAQLLRLVQDGPPHVEYVPGNKRSGRLYHLIKSKKFVPINSLVILVL